MNARILALCALFAAATPLLAGEAAKSPDRGRAQPIDLATALRLAGAQNVDVKLAAERSTLAQAEHTLAQEQFFPWITFGAGYRGHQENIQTVEGRIIDAEKSAVDFGGSLKAQLDLGEAYFKSLSTHQLVKAASFASDAQVQDATLAAALGYFDLVRAQAYVGVTSEAVRISADYETQVRRAVEAGIAFAGDAYRIQTQLELNRLTYRQALETRRIAAARLAQVLQLDPVVNLLPEEAAPVPLKLVSPDDSLEGFVQRAMVHRPELHMSAAQREAARRARDGARYGPLVPTLGAQYSYGGLAGGVGSEIANFNDSSDYGVGLSWRVGPGGLFDLGRIAAGESRLRATVLEGQKLRDEIVRQVVESHTRVRSLGDQLGMALRALQAAQKTLDLSRERKEFGVGIVAETIQAEQDLTRSRRDYLGTVAEYNKAQFTLQWSVGMKSGSH
jgi:outer membrane protein TolC